jgi:hypothetical protein
MTFKDEHANPMVKFNMEEGALISIQLKSISIPIVFARILPIAPLDLRVDVRVEAIEVTFMEE